MNVMEEKKEVETYEIEHVSSNGDERDLDTIEATKPGAFVWLVALATAIGGLLFGYDTGVISGVLVVIGSDLNGRPISDSEKELITSLTSAGAFVGAVIVGFCADKFGRKPCIWFGSVLFTIGAIIQASSFTIAQMSVGRFTIGLGVGAAAMIVPLYIAEISPARFRGRMVTADAISITGGQVVAYAIDAAFYKVDGGWRYMVAIGAFPSICLGVFLFWCPESPRQLIYHNKPEECAQVLRRIYPNATEEQVQDKVTLIQRGVSSAIALNEDMTFAQTFKTLYTVPANLRALVVACGLMAIQQLCGFNTLMYYSSTLFAIVGFSNPIAVGTTVAATNFIFTGISLWKIDQIGRRRMLVWTMWGMWVALLLAAVAFHYIPIDDSTLALETSNPGWAGNLVLGAIIIFVAFYATGLGNVPWQANEFLPMEVRAIGTMMITCTCWGMNLVVSATFLSMMKGITPSGAFGFYTALCFVGWIAVIFTYPEVSNMTLEQIRNVFEHGFGVRYAEQWRKQRKADIKEARIPSKA